MTPAPATATRAALASALSLTALLTTAACTADDRVRSGLPAGVEQEATASASTAAPAAEQPSTAPPAGLTEAQLRAALITEMDLGEPWVPTRGVATWRDGLLKAQVEDEKEDAPCRRLLDALYTEELFGAPAGPRAVVTLDDAYNGSQLRYQVASYRPEDVDRTLQWMRTLPDTCGEFTARTARAGEQGVEVEELELPDAGDARAALRVTMTGETADGEPTYLTVDLAAVRVGEDTITLTNGGYGEIAPEVSQGVVELGAERLTEIRRQGRLEV
ncbi:hypothetical protein N4P33_25490 [Streptomyces sp. 15-116A]|uniref:hypothetical protein n=1 Tax=Streptomyces sp. 15-116A TaxID=2259035 RepID=UPI0021B23F7D|nr:hypothetical protein [Streptomyces sp. 15-116A]MCT7355484.1 hypothetical protein [Streptomyces sp. 15-116A]